MYMTCMYYSIVHTRHIHGSDMYIHVYARVVGFQMFIISLIFISSYYLNYFYFIVLYQLFQLNTIISIFYSIVLYHLFFSYVTSCRTPEQCLQPPCINHISRDHPNAHELTNHIPHPSPAPGLRSPGAPGKTLRRWYRMVPVSPTGTTASFPRIL